MQTKTFEIRACSNGAIGSDWEAQLAGWLKSPPRRLSRWTKLGLFGALQCLRQSGAAALPNAVPIRVHSEYGTLAATKVAVAQASDHLPMPFSFMQTQPGQLFNALGTALDWHGDGALVSCSDRVHSEIALLRGIRQAALLAWVDDEPALLSRWIWLQQATMTAEPQWRRAGSLFDVTATARWLKIDHDNQIYQAE